MAIAIMILGESGTGKSSSIRTLDPSTTAIINVDNKPLPFRTKFDKSFSTDSAEDICICLDNAVKAKCTDIIIDDSQAIMSNEYMRRAKDVGYGKFTEIGQHFFTVLDKVRSLPNNVKVYFLHHIEVDQWGNTKAKTIGKMLDSVVTVESKFTIVLQTVVENGQYYFMTHNNGSNTVKSPFDMFEQDRIPNDLKLVSDTVDQYYTVF